MKIGAKNAKRIFVQQHALNASDMLKFEENVVLRLWFKNMSVVDEA